MAAEIVWKLTVISAMTRAAAEASKIAQGDPQSAERDIEDVENQLPGNRRDHQREKPGPRRTPDRPALFVRRLVRDQRQYDRQYAERVDDREDRYRAFCEVDQFNHVHLQNEEFLAQGRLLYAP